MADERLQVGVEGAEVVLVFTDQDGAAVNISAASAITFRFRKPDGTTADKTLAAAEVALDGDGTDGKAVYSTEAAFIDQAGKWQVQGFATTAAGYWPAGPEPLWVVSNLVAP